MPLPLNIHKPEDLLECDSKTLASITDKEYEEFFSVCLDVTRPELAAAKEAPSRIGGPVKGAYSKGPSAHDLKMQKAREIAAQFGLKL